MSYNPWWLKPEHTAHRCTGPAKDRADGRCHNRAERDGLCKTHAPKLPAERWIGWAVIERGFMETFTSKAAARGRFLLRQAGGWPCRLVEVEAVATIHAEAKPK